MNTQIKERADKLHTDALSSYALELDEQYQAVVKGQERRHIQLLRWNALALLGSPYHQLNHLELSEAECLWLLQVVKMSNAELLQVVTRAMGDHARMAVDGFTQRNARIVELQKEIETLKGQLLPQNDGSNLGRHKLFKK